MGLEYTCEACGETISEEESYRNLIACWGYCDACMKEINDSLCDEVCECCEVHRQIQSLKKEIGNWEDIQGCDQVHQ